MGRAKMVGLPDGLWVGGLVGWFWSLVVLMLLWLPTGGLPLPSPLLAFWSSCLPLWLWVLGAAGWLPLACFLVLSRGWQCWLVCFFALDLESQWSWFVFSAGFFGREKGDLVVGVEGFYVVLRLIVISLSLLCLTQNAPSLSPPLSLLVVWLGKMYGPLVHEALFVGFL